MNFKITDKLDDSRIIPFLLNDDRSSIYHHPAWVTAISSTFNHDAYYLIKENNRNQITGLLPFIAINSRITGKRIVSLPLTTYCNPLLEDDMLPLAINSIKDKFSGYKIFEFRTLRDYRNKLDDFSVNLSFHTHILDLVNSLEEIFNSFHPTSVRASIRRAEKNNLKIRWGDKLDDLKAFYGLEVSLRKRLLLPPLPFSFYKNLWLELSKVGLISLPLVSKDNQVIAAGFILNFKDTYYLEYTASDKNFLNLYPNHKLFYEVIKKAFFKGAAKIDFGRTSNDNTSLAIFKEKWNAKKYQLYQYIFPEEKILRPGNSGLLKYLKLVNRVMPKKLLMLEGKLIYPHFG
jgi:hypothetical protein